MHTSIRISAAEYSSRAGKLLEYIQANKLAGVVIFDNFYILYLTGFAFIPTERPIAFLMNSRGDRSLYVPRLEFEHADSNAVVDRVEYYPEYPFKPHPMVKLKEILVDMGIQGKFGADNDGYPWLLGYRGPSLSELIGDQFIRIASFLEDMMRIKSPAEIMLVRESVKWGHLAHTLLQRYTQVGASETEVSQQASMEATLTMLDTIGPIYRAMSPFSAGAEAGFRGQIGRNAAIPHSLSSNIRFQPGDVLVSGANAPVWGYNSELERTMILGKASAEQRKFFSHMMNLQETAFSALRPGVRCSEVDLKVRAYYEENQLMPYWKHHVGHAIGLRYHEGPFLDLGDETEIQPGMIFTIEPGLYVPELGGFRHSDTVLIKDDGIEILTYYPRDLESLTIPI
jgi:Xaa-Pro aminopeptidase